MAGYSGTPLAKKLGVKPDSRLLLVDPPDRFAGELVDLPPGATVTTRLHQPIDCVLVFAFTQAQISRQLKRIVPRLAPAGGLWLAWPKKGAKLATDLTENTVRDLGLATGLVDNKVCAINETWSGLRFVFRLKDRPR
jgi:hypothetical protein